MPSRCPSTSTRSGATRLESVGQLARERFVKDALRPDADGTPRGDGPPPTGPGTTLQPVRTQFEEVAKRVGTYRKGAGAESFSVDMVSLDQVEAGAMPTGRSGLSLVDLTADDLDDPIDASAPTLLEKLTEGDF